MIKVSDKMRGECAECKHDFIEDVVDLEIAGRVVTLCTGCAEKLSAGLLDKVHGLVLEEPDDSCDNAHNA